MGEDTQHSSRKAGKRPWHQSLIKKVSQFGFASSFIASHSTNPHRIDSSDSVARLYLLF